MSENSEEIVDVVEVVPEDRILLFELIVSVPLFKCLRDVVLAEIEHALGVRTSLLLQAPRRRIVEIELSAWAGVPVLLEVVAHVDPGVRSRLLLQAVVVVVVFVNRVR